MFNAAVEPLLPSISENSAMTVLRMPFVTHQANTLAVIQVPPDDFVERFGNPGIRVEMVPIQPQTFRVASGLPAKALGVAGEGEVEVLNRMRFEGVLQAPL